MQNYDNMYSIVSPHYLENFINNNNYCLQHKNEIYKLFDVLEVYNRRVEKLCISITLFASHPANTEELTYEEPDYKNKNSNWYKRYYISLVSFIKDFNRNKFYYNFKIRIYLENKLYCFIDELLSLSSHIEIYYMKNNTIGSQPGMLWRYLSFDDKSLDIVFATDIDVDFESTVTLPLKSFINNNKTMGRLFTHPLCDIRLDKTSYHSTLLYTVCSGHMIMFRPKNIDISMKDLYVNYILYRKYRITTQNPCEEFDDKNTSRFNKPFCEHTYGWGGIWTMYGFDEKLFKHTIFPYFAQKGEVLSLGYNAHLKYIETANINDPLMIDYNFTKSFKNEFLYIF